jgi:hypothetical protein
VHLRLVSSVEELHEPVLSVDGAFGAPGLNLSHWPGNSTPRDLRHDLSTGSALAFASLSARGRAERLRGISLAVNNHYDTDGACALFAATRPEQARKRAGRLLTVAAAGDFYEYPDDHALCVDILVGALPNHEASPLAAELAGLPARARHEASTRFLMDALPEILDGDLLPYREMIEPRIEEARRDAAELARASSIDVSSLDLWIFACSEPLDAGRHALFGTRGRDRVLLACRIKEGTTYRLILSTLSWFDLVTRERAARPDLAALAAALNAAEGAAPAGWSWRHQDTSSPTPELWFGVDQPELFAERCPFLRPSRLPFEQVRREIETALEKARVR